MESVARSVPAGAASASRAGGLPWYLTATVAGAASIVVGLLWDISWHSTIGRDTFWTPAHLAIYLGGLLAGLSCGALALCTTFRGTAEEPAAGVGLWGFRAPLGAWVAIWGALAMVTSAPFDDWWHNAYGLDVEIVSPPHMVLAAGMLGVMLGAMLLAVAAQNRAGWVDPHPGAASRAYVLAAGVLVVMFATLLMEYSDPNLQHGARFHELSCALYPALLAAAARGSRLRWPATATAGVYTAIKCLMVWILPLFPARPLLAPIYNPVDHMWPTTFPLLLLLPALAIDLALQRLGPGRDGLAAPVLGGLFVALFLPAQWLSADFMLTPWARNWFFGADQWWYIARPGPWRYEFWDAADDPVTLGTIVLLVLLATVSAWVGLAWGGWMSRVRR